MQIKFVTKAMFLDRPGVEARMGKKMHRVVMFAGGRTRKYMQYNMRYRDRPAPPGTFPSAHRGHAHLRKYLYFGLDGETGLVGPWRLPGVEDKAVVAAGMTVPQVVNEGGRFRRGNAIVRQLPRPYVGLTAPYAADQLAMQAVKVGL